MASAISCQNLAVLMASEELYAVFDVRERGEYNAGHISLATSLPRSQIEFRIADLVPNAEIPIVVYDEGGGRAALAAGTLNEIGYSNVSLLDGGLPVWVQQGYATASGVNVPSKAFGEKVHHQRKVREILPEDLKRLQDNGADLIVLDVRTPEEYRRFCVPAGINIPGGDLVLWVEHLRHKPRTTIVVNCAGRTRGIIGTAALNRLALSNVYALRNGTMGWVLAGLELESKPSREGPRAPAESRDKAAHYALQLAQEEKIPQISVQDLEKLLAEKNAGVTYVIDVRSEGEYDRGHIRGSLNIPGGQAVQRADDFIAVKNGRIIFVSDQSARAVMAAYWYRQMGYRDVAVLRGGLRAWLESGKPLARGTERTEPLGFDLAKRSARFKTATEIHKRLQDPGVTVLDVGSSVDFNTGHLLCARWISRGWLEQKLPIHVPDRNESIILSCSDGKSSVLAARTVAEMGYRNVDVLDGGVHAWTAAGYSTDTGLDACLVEPNDVVLSPSVTGDREQMKRYLEWEMKLKG